MAIKGKRKTRGRPRTVASAPRPFLVPPRTPPLRRRSVQAFLIFLVLGGIAALGAGLRAGQDSERRREEVQQFSAQVNAILQSSGITQAIGPTPLVLPQISATFAELGKREPKGVDRMVEDARDWETAATNTAEDIAAVRVDESESRVTLQESRDLMEEGLSLYAAVAAQIPTLTRLDEPARAALIPSLEQQVESAAAIFAAGWDKLTREEQLVGLPVQLIGPPGGGLPGGGLPGGGFPAP